VLATLDMGYRRRRVGAEYDGRDHDTKRNRIRDSRRHNRLKGAGWHVLQYGSEDIRLRRHVIRREVCEAVGR
jgi:very-short-patch-repair endonuclease